MPAERNRLKLENFNPRAQLPIQLRLEDFEIAMQEGLSQIVGDLVKSGELSPEC